MIKKTKPKKDILYYRKILTDDTSTEMLKQSNLIEREVSEKALEDAIKAWKYAIRNSQNVTSKYVLKIHRLLCARINYPIAGKWRDYTVYIGGEAKPYISQDLIREEVKSWLRKYNILKKPVDLKLQDKKTFEKLAKEAHIHFEDIHPFIDGNGRVGRILYNVHRLKLGLPIHIINEGEDQYKYYKWFKKKI